MRGALMLGFGKSKKQLETKVAELENRLNNLSWHDMSSEQWGELFGAIPASAGIAVTPVSAKRSTAVYACTNLIAGAFAITTLKFYEKKSGDERVEIDHDLWWLFNREPNPTLTASSLWDWTVSDKLLRGDGLIELHRNRKGDVEAISNVARDSAMIERSKSSKFRLNYHVDDVEKKRGIFQEDLLHIPGPGFNGVNGESVIKYAARDAVSTALAADRFSGSFFANGAHPSVVIEYPQGVAPKQEQIDNLRTQFEERYTGNDNHHRPMLLVNGGKANSISMSAEDAQLIETRRFQVNDIARAFGVPPVLIGESDKTSSWGTGIEQLKRSFLVFALSPRFRLVEQEINRKLFGRGSKIYAEFDRDGWMSGDSKAESEYLAKALGGPGAQGWQTINEVRKSKNLPPIEGGDKLIIAGTAGETNEPETTDTN